MKAQNIRALIDAAVAAEREECAQIAESERLTERPNDQDISTLEKVAALGAGWVLRAAELACEDTAHSIAAKIRSRGAKDGNRATPSR